MSLDEQLALSADNKRLKFCVVAKPLQRDGSATVDQAGAAKKRRMHGAARLDGEGGGGATSGTITDVLFSLRESEKILKIP